MAGSRASAVAILPGRAPAGTLLADANAVRETPASPAAVVEYGIKRLAGGTEPLSALPAVLRRLAAAFGAEAAIAFELGSGHVPVSRAAHPAGAATADLMAELRVLSVLHGRTVAAGGSFTAKVHSAAAPPAAGRAGARNVLVAYSAPGAAERSCAIALAGGPARWNREARPALRTLATVIGREVSRAALASHPLAGDEPGEARFRLLSRIAPVGIVLFDAAGQCTFVNDRWCDWTGAPPQVALGAGWADALHPDDVSRVEAEAIKAMDGGSELRTDCRLVAPGRAPRWVSAVVMPLLDVHGRADGYLAAVTDVSERKEQAAERERFLAGEQSARKAAESARHELASRLDRLRELDELKTQFLASVSHELRTPLASIISFAELILAEEQALSGESREYLGIVERNAEQLLRLVGDLMLLSGLDTGVVTLQCGDVAVGELVKDSVASGSVAAGRAGVTLTGAVQEGPPALGDRLRLRQVLDNVIGNAVKFTPAGGHVTVRATHDERHWRFDVQDEGIGIPADEVDQLFGRFYRASNAVTSGKPGSGIGLSIVQMITQRHGGRVEVSSVVGSGTTFSVLIPVRR